MAAQSMASVWSDIPRRLATISVAVPFLWCLWLTNATRQLFFQVVHLLVTLEWVQLTAMAGVWRYLYPCFSIALSNISDDRLFLSCLIGGIALTCIFAQETDKQTDVAKRYRSRERVTTSILVGALMLIIPFRSWIIVANEFRSIVNLLLTVWNADTGALLAGRLSKGRRVGQGPPRWLAQISPNKSVVGLAGGVWGAAITYVGLPSFWNLMEGLNLAPTNNERYAPEGLVERVTIGVVLGCLAITGDLWESYWKRYFGVKDTSKLLPGHGGILDRFDSSLLAVLFYQYYLDKP